MIDFLVNIGHTIMTPLYYLTSGILVLWHDLFYDILRLLPGLVVGAVHHLPDDRASGSR